MIPDSVTVRPPGRVLRAVPVAALAAVIVITASSEWTLARTVLALPPAVAWAVPVAIDSYVVAALRTGRDVLPALAVMAGALCASTAAHLAAAGRPVDEALPVQVVAPTATVVMAVLVVVAWRVHVLIERLTPDVSASAVQGQAPHAPEYTRPAEMRTPAVSAPSEANTARESPATPRASSPSRSGAVALRANDGPSLPTVREPVPLTDSEILGQIGDHSPGIRNLMRTYGIGQKRATRLHQQVLNNQDDAATRDANEKANRTNDKEQPDSARKTTPSTHSRKSEMPFKETHPGITDRVGGDPDFVGVTGDTTESIPDSDSVVIGGS